MANAAPDPTTDPTGQSDFGNSLGDTADPGLFPTIQPAAASNTSRDGLGIFTGFRDDSTWAPGQRHAPNNVPTYDTIGNYSQSTLYGMPRAQLKQLQEKLVQVGYLQPDWATGLLNAQTVNAYGDLLQDVSTANDAGNLVTPDQYLHRLVKQGVGSDGANGTKQGPTTQTYTTVENPEDARALAIAKFREKLGRRPKQGELDAFYAALTAWEHAHPTVAYSDGKGNSTTSGGGSADNFADQYVDTQYGAQEGSHDALHYFDLTVNALTSPPGGVHHVTN